MSRRERQAEILTAMEIPLWLERSQSAPQPVADLLTENTPVEPAEGLGVNLSGSAMSGYLWLLEDSEPSTSEKTLLAKVQLAVAGEGESLLATYQPDSVTDFAATIKDRLITRVVVFGTPEFISQIVTAVDKLAVEVIASPPLAELAESNSLKRKLWEQLKAANS